MMTKTVEKAAEAIRTAKHLTAFTGAGISVESGIPPFRGENGIWNSYDPSILEIHYFKDTPEACWPSIKAIFYQHFSKAAPNPAHYLLAELEQQGRLKAIITQNIDNLHQRAGSKRVIEYHGNSSRLLCTDCGAAFPADTKVRDEEIPRCSCGSVLKPDFIFFGEAIPRSAAVDAEKEAQKSDVMLLIGSTGEVYPAAMIPRIAAQNGACIVEINPANSAFSDTISSIHIKESASRAAELLSMVIDGTNL